MRQLFISYARENKNSVEELVHHLDNLGYQSWVDSSLRGGQTWWEEILRRISRCDVFLAMVSRSSLNSVACKRELEWALALAKPILPVALERLPEALPRDLSTLQIVDYSVPGQQSAFALAGALAALPPAPPLPAELPESPSAPLSYLTDLIDQVSQSDPLTHEQQRQILVQLQPSLGAVDPEERQGGHYIFEMFSRRDDLYADVARTLDDWGIGKHGATAPAMPPAFPETMPTPGSAVFSEQPKPPHSPPAMTAAEPPEGRPPATTRRSSPVLIWAAVISAAAAIIAVVALLVILPRLGHDSGQSGPATTPTTMPTTKPGTMTTTAPSTSIERAETLPADARACPSSDPIAEFRSSAVGNDATSCQFAEEVRREYISQPNRDAPVQIQASSPVTGQTYEMTCIGHRVVRCTGGNNAVVYLY